MKRAGRVHVCGTLVILNERHDAYYCPKCLVWVEGECGDRVCSFCDGRPAQPVGDDDARARRRAEARAWFVRMAEEAGELPACKFCGRTVMAGVCCPRALGAARDALLRAVDGEGDE